VEGLREKGLKEGRKGTPETERKEDKKTNT